MCFKMQNVIIQDYPHFDEFENGRLVGLKLFNLQLEIKYCTDRKNLIMNFIGL